MSGWSETIYFELVARDGFVDLYVLAFFEAVARGEREAMLWNLSSCSRLIVLHNCAQTSTRTMEFTDRLTLIQQDPNAIRGHHFSFQSQQVTLTRTLYYVRTEASMGLRPSEGVLLGSGRRPTPTPLLSTLVTTFVLFPASFVPFPATRSYTCQPVVDPCSGAHVVPV